MDCLALRKAFGICMQADPDGASCLNAMIPAGNTPTQLVGRPTLEYGHVRIPFVQQIVQQNVQQIKIPRSADIPKYRIVSVYSGMYQDVEGGGLAERKGFEPSIRVNVYALSRGAPSATRPPLQRGIWGLEKPNPDRKPLSSVERSKSLVLDPAGHAPHRTASYVGLRMARTALCANLGIVSCQRPRP